MRGFSPSESECEVNPLYWPARHEETILTTSICKFHPDVAGKVKVWWGGPIIAAVPKLRAAMHLGTVFTFADRDCVLLYPSRHSCRPEGSGKGHRAMAYT